MEGREFIEMLPIMDMRNRSIPVEQVTSMDSNRAIQRSLTKAVARHGLGLYIYAGEDLPETERAAEPEPEPAPEPEEDLGKLRGQILDMADGDIARVNVFLAKVVRGEPTLFDLNGEQLRTVRDIIAKRLGKE